jgi:hypothetical protein
MLKRIRLYLSSAVNHLEDFAELAFAGVIPMTDDGIPVLDEDLSNIKYYEPWRLVIKQINTPHLRPCPGEGGYSGQPGF